MRIFVLTSDHYIKAVRAFAYLFNRYWSKEQEVIALEAQVQQLQALQIAIDSNGHYCDGMSTAWSDAQEAIGQVAALQAERDEIQHKEMVAHRVEFSAERDRRIKAETALDAIANSEMGEDSIAAQNYTLQAENAALRASLRVLRGRLCKWCAAGDPNSGRGHGSYVCRAEDALIKAAALKAASPGESTSAGEQG